MEGIVGGLSADTLETLDVCSLLRDVISTTVRVTTLLEFHAGGRIVASILNKIQTGTCCILISHLNFTQK